MQREKTPPFPSSIVHLRTSEENELVLGVVIISRQQSDFEDIERDFQQFCQSREFLFTLIEYLVITNAHCFLHLMNGDPEYLILVGLFPRIVVYTRIAHLTICDDLVSAFTCQDETPLQASVVIDIGISHHESKDQRCVVFVTYK